MKIASPTLSATFVGLDSTNLEPSSFRLLLPANTSVIANQKCFVKETIVVIQEGIVGQDITQVQTTANLLLLNDHTFDDRVPVHGSGSSWESFLWTFFKLQPLV